MDQLTFYLMKIEIELFFPFNSNLKKTIMFNGIFLVGSNIFEYFLLQSLTKFFLSTNLLVRVKLGYTPYFSRWVGGVEWLDNSQTRTTFGLGFRSKISQML